MAKSTKAAAKPKEERALVAVQARLPMPDGLSSEFVWMTPAEWQVMTDALYPEARTSESIVLVLRYCHARKLDPMKKPVHIVPIWSSAAGRKIESIWPGIAEVRTTAQRTGDYAGLDEPKWGPDTARKFEGKAKQEGRWEDVEAEVTFPAWCKIQVWRMVQGVRCPFVQEVYWEEAYGQIGRSTVPNDMWQRRKRGQLAKCAEAAALRAAFPEELGNQYTAEEMAGQVVDYETVSARGGTAAEVTDATDAEYTEEWDLVDEVGEVSVWYDPADWVSGFVQAASRVPAERQKTWREDNDVAVVLARLHEKGLSDLISRVNEAGPAPEQAQEAKTNDKAETPKEDTEAAPEPPQGLEMAAQEGADMEDLDDLAGDLGADSVPDITDIEEDAPKDEWRAWMLKFRSHVVELDEKGLKTFVEIHSEQLGWLKGRGQKAYDAMMKEVTIRKEALLSSG